MDILHKEKSLKAVSQEAPSTQLQTRKVSFVEKLKASRSKPAYSPIFETRKISFTNESPTNPRLEPSAQIAAAQVYNQC